MCMWLHRKHNYRSNHREAKKDANTDQLVHFEPHHLRLGNHLYIHTTDIDTSRQCLPQFPVWKNWVQLCNHAGTGTFRQCKCAYSHSHLFCSVHGYQSIWLPWIHPSKVRWLHHIPHLVIVISGAFSDIDGKPWGLRVVHRCSWTLLL